METRVRIADVAAAAGVSTATVSRTLSSPDVVGAETRARVMAAIDATGYQINAAARDLRRRRARTILVLAPNLANTFFSRIVAAIQNVAGEAGLAVQISDSRTSKEVLARLGREGRADGILLLDGSLPPDIVRGWRLPVIQLCEWNEEYGLPSLRIDNAAAARMAVDHLVELGHRTLLHISGPAGNILGRVRKAGFLEAAAETGVDAQVVNGDFTMGSGVAAARAWAAMTDRPTAIFTASDECAFGFVSECNAMGIRVPSDVSVIGFDDVDFAGHYIPALTTIHQPRARLGRMAAERLIDALQSGEPLGRDDIFIDPHLVIRGSTGPHSTRR
ncbi:LacI family transcription regulator [Roseivivax halodurans JCM 10272]|uniref:LacI family transcription regulator n=1 Tax=Roseivivax halodurans JCM 10272 TaxID=1449350 RepID=X7EL04_9RHOB|nr:LacI family DNA-binding transcriptional regulator [Roseivivax halodurans]ETX16565.1 LacI family transcription regulator [Roseivivax halodurans JCM 10272]